ncbi:hypothetical protein J437_LFUL002888 [Ladona fulva]|uniref:Uncharacterized protein n=1 Tax=Ladona fulva TaxID=123851 RepID=A0A8K0P910_LADFU|nr:hypothetical protein J437_LFUL002888 [Ladona fulva]
MVLSGGVNIVVFGMAAPAACTRFSDNYDLKEELGNLRMPFTNGRDRFNLFDEGVSGPKVRGRAKEGWLYEWDALRRTHVF